MPNTKTSTQHFLALVTAPDLKTARTLGKLALTEKMAACANLIPKLESHYWWQGKLDKSAEVLILFKTTRKNVRPLEELILKHHPYDTPEFIAFPVGYGNRRYLDWMSSSTA